jgi:hypothetical protein
MAVPPAGEKNPKPSPDSAQQRDFAMQGCHGALAVGGLAAFERAEMDAELATTRECNVFPSYRPTDQTKIPFLLHWPLNEIQQCLLASTN